MSPLRVLCLFSSAALRDASFFARHVARHWVTDIDQGPCEFVPLVIDDEMAALASSRLFAAATVLCRPADLDPALTAALRAGADAFAAAGLPLEVVAAEGPVRVLAWLAEHAPGLVACCRADGEVRPESPSWWRDRAKGHLARQAEGAAATPAPEDLATELRAFVSRRGW